MHFGTMTIRKFAGPNTPSKVDSERALLLRFLFPFRSLSLSESDVRNLSSSHSRLMP